jgi:hypothetical protein
VQQENAIDLLVTGATDREAAESVKVHRVTVTKWRNYDPAFAAELNRAQPDDADVQAAPVAWCKPGAPTYAEG